LCQDLDGVERRHLCARQREVRDELVLAVLALYATTRGGKPRGADVYEIVSAALFELNAEVAGRVSGGLLSKAVWTACHHDGGDDSVR
jgi:hypothetical protein